MIKVIYNKVCGRCVQSEPLTSGMVGQTILFEYSHDFDGLTLTAVFTNGKTTVDVLNPGTQCVIPHEVLDTVGTLVKVGIYAVRGNELVIPTVYATIGVALKGADPSGDVSIDPTLPVWAQTQALIGNLSQIETETKDSLVAAINEVKQTADRKANAADLAPVATSGSYSDLTDKPTIPSVPTATIAANTAARHTHDNKTLLDSITEALKTAWNTASEWVITNGANVLSHLADSVRHITATERSVWNGKQDKLIAGENITIAADGKTISATGGGLTTAQVNALNGMFKVCAFAKANVSAEYTEFKTAFGIAESSGGGGSGETGVSNESTWTDGVAYTFNPVNNTYIESNGAETVYNDWSSSPYLYCDGASQLVFTVLLNSSMLSANNNYNAFYDENKTFISKFSIAGIGNATVDGAEIGATKEITIPGNAAYFRVSHKAGVYGNIDSDNPILSITPKA